jgi:uncharacterized membrane protein YdcZ (DUF606 family)
LSSLRSILLSGLGVLSGGLIAIQSVLNSSLGQRTGNFGSVLVLTFVSVAVLVTLIFFFPSTSDYFGCSYIFSPTDWNDIDVDRHRAWTIPIRSCD